MKVRRVLVGGLLCLGWATIGSATEPQSASPDRDAIERGRIALTARSHIQAAWSLDAYKKASRFWPFAAPDPDADPEGYARAFERRYGLHPAPYPNDGLPMGLRLAPRRSGNGMGLTIDCMVCHGGSIGGQSHVGLGNSTLDLRSLLDDLTRADDRTVPPSLFTLTTTRGTVNAGQISVALFSLRNPDLSRRAFPLRLGAWLPELNTPPWWNLAPKRTMYQDGRTDARSHRSLMQFFLDDYELQDFQRMEPTFRDIMAYLKSLEPPRYPFPIDQARADRGASIFQNRCAKCHGTYAQDGSVDYPNVLVELDRVGTDRKRAEGISRKFVEHYNASWFGEDHQVDAEMIGYQAPPLRGIWATAPYFHNGVVPTLYHVLNSSSRPDRFRRPESTAFEQYDTKRVGWLFETVNGPIPNDSHPFDARFTVDTSRFGLDHGGHTFGDALSEPERFDLIEYLKTL